MSKSAVRLCTTFFALTLAAIQLSADSITLNNFQIIPVPFSGFFQAIPQNVSINDSGTIAGTLFNSTVNQSFIGFVIPAGGAAAAIQVPGALFTSVTGINDSGTLAGYSVSSSTFKNEGFTYSGGTFKIVNAGNSPVITGINNNGDIVGTQTGALLIHAGVTTTLSVPGFAQTFPGGVNDSDEVVVSASNGGSQSGFLRQSNGQFKALNFIPYGINDAGTIVGSSSSPLDNESFIMIGGTDYSFAVPGASYTDLSGINNNNEVVGIYGVGFASYIFEGQLPPVTPIPEPASEAALGMMIISGMLMCRRVTMLCRVKAGETACSTVSRR